MSRRRIKISIQEQGQDEQISWSIDTTNWTTSPSNVTCTLYDITDPLSWTDVTSTKMSGSASVASAVISSPEVTGLLDNRKYRLEFRFDDGAGNTLEPYMIIRGEK